MEVMTYRNRILHSPDMIKAMGIIRQFFHPGAVIAGGFLRDIALQRPWKDVDVFVRPSQIKQELFDFLRMTDMQALERITSAADKQGVLEEYGNDFFQQITISVMGIELNLVVSPKAHDAKSMTEEVDMTVCAIAYSDEDGLLITPQFLSDAEAEVFRVQPSGRRRGVNRSRKRYERLLEKYPGWGFIDDDPDEAVDDDLDGLA